MKIVAISGWQKSGKDHAAKILIGNYGFKRVAFADPLKDSVAAEYGFDRASLDDQAMKELPIKEMPVYARDEFSENLIKFMFREFRLENGQRPTYYLKHEDGNVYGGNGDVHPGRLYWTRRALMILKGSTMRTANPDYWVEKAIRAARSQGLDKVVISDLRYRNEVYAMKTALDIEDELITIRVNRFDTSPSQDPSERDLDDAAFDFTIENRGTLEDFENSIREIYKKTLRDP